MQFDTRIILGDGAFAESGRPTGVYWDQRGARLAVASTFNVLQWHGRDIQARCALSYRVAVYDAHPLHRVAVFDLARFPINDVAFHPHRPLLAIATGSYDGGYYYEGALLLWDWSTGEAASLLDESREVTRCRFDDVGRALHITLRPPDDTVEGETQLLLQATIASDTWEPLRQRGVVTPERNPPWAMEYHVPSAGLIASKPLDLGHYDLVNHYMHIDGAPHLYLIQGTPPTSHEERRICRIDPQSLRIERLFPMACEPPRGRHLSVDSGAYLHDRSGEALVLGYQRSDARGLQEGGALIVRRRLPDGRVLWTTSFDAPVTALIAVPERNAMSFALNNGRRPHQQPVELPAIGSRPGKRLLPAPDDPGQRVLVG